MARKPYLVFVSWQDASLTQGEMEEYVPYLVESVGWLVQNDAEAVRLAPWKTLSGPNFTKPAYSDVLTIPRGMVRKIRRLH